MDIHGGNIYKTAKEYGIGQDEILDYSANINPLGVPESVRKNIISTMDKLTNYPDPECTDLKAGISAYVGIPQENIIVGNGASEIIFLLFEALEIKSLLLPAPTFAEYAKAAQRLKVEIKYFEMKEEDDFRLNVESLMESITEGMDAILLCNPNNPTSKLVSKAGLLTLLEYAKTKNIVVILDEAFIELTCEGTGSSMAEYIPLYDKLFIVRAFTKLFAIPGLRLGYGVGDREIIRKMWHKKMPWSVNSFACSLGNIFSEEQAYLHKTALWLAAEKERFYAELCKLEKLKVFEPQANFILLKILEEGLSSSQLRDRFARKGILIRDASNFTFLNDSYIRIAVKDRESNERFMRVVRKVMYDG